MIQVTKYGMTPDPCPPAHIYFSVAHMPPEVAYFDKGMKFGCENGSPENVVPPSESSMVAVYVNSLHSLQLAFFVCVS